MGAPLTSVLTLIHGQTAKVIDFSETTGILWETDALKDPRWISSRPLIIIWRGASSADGPWLTVYDWLVALIATHNEKPKSLDVTVVDIATEETESELLFRSLHLKASWLKIHRTMGLNGSDLATARRDNWQTFFSPQHHANLSALAGPPTTPGAQEDEWTHTRKLLVAAWTSALTRAEGRHRISNEIAPHVLANALDLSEPTGRPKRLATLLISLKLISPVVATPTKATDAPSNDTKRLLQENIFDQFSRRLRVILVDDSEAAGFSNIVRGALDRALEENYRFRAFSSPEMIIAILERIVQRRDTEDNHLTIPVDILFLDLRLFDLSEERGRLLQKRMLERLLAIDEQLPAPHSAAAFDAITRATSAAKTYDPTRQDDMTQPEMFALLPLVLSILDPSLPIVLFSSTGNRDVLDLFKPFPNIIMDFQKPLVSGYQQSTLEGSSPGNRLFAAIARALELHETRLVWRRIERFQNPRPFVFTRCAVRGEKNWDSAPVDHRSKSGHAKKMATSFYNVAHHREESAVATSCPQRSSQLPPTYRLPPEDNIKQALRDWYIRHLLTSDFEPLETKPYEYLESRCLPTLDEESHDKIVCEDYVEVWQPKFAAAYPEVAVEKKNERFYFFIGRNSLAVSLKHNRHRSAHGFGSSKDAEDPRSRPHHYLRAVSMLQVLVFMDFLVGARVVAQNSTLLLQDDPKKWVPPSGIPTWKLRHRWHGERYSMQTLTMDSAVDWPTFAIWSHIVGAYACPEYLHVSTLGAIERLGRRRKMIA